MCEYLRKLENIKKYFRILENVSEYTSKQITRYFKITVLAQRKQYSDKSN